MASREAVSTSWLVKGAPATSTAATLVPGSSSVLVLVLVLVLVATVLVAGLAVEGEV